MKTENNTIGGKGNWRLEKGFERYVINMKKKKHIHTQIHISVCRFLYKKANLSNVFIFSN